MAHAGQELALEAVGSLDFAVAERELVVGGLESRSDVVVTASGQHIHCSGDGTQSSRESGTPAR